MATPRLYIDSCCVIEALKQRFNKKLDHPAEADMIERLLRASRAGDIEIFTSTLTVAEVVYIGERPVTDEIKLAIERLLLSGRDGIKTVAPDPMIVTKARDLYWNDGLFDKPIDRLHVASAIIIAAEELLTLDGRLAKKANRTKIEDVKLIAASDTGLLPDRYKTDSLFD